MHEVLVIGHRNPDTDAICSAIGYAEFKRCTGLPGAVAARCGDTNDRIDSVLRQINHPEREPGIYELKGIVSRKKQLLPYLVHCLEQL